MVLWILYLSFFDQWRCLSDCLIFILKTSLIISSIFFMYFPVFYKLSLYEHSSSLNEHLLERDIVWSIVSLLLFIESWISILCNLSFSFCLLSATVFITHFSLHLHHLFQSFGELLFILLSFFCSLYYISIYIYIYIYICPSFLLYFLG